MSKRHKNYFKDLDDYSTIPEGYLRYREYKKDQKAYDSYIRSISEDTLLKKSNIDFDDFKINVAPFLVNALSCINVEEKVWDDFYLSLSEISKAIFKDSTEGINEFNTFWVEMPSIKEMKSQQLDVDSDNYSIGLIWRLFPYFVERRYTNGVFLYLYYKRKGLFLKAMHKFFYRLITRFSDELILDSLELTCSYKSNFCDTARLSFCIAMYWALSVYDFPKGKNSDSKFYDSQFWMTKMHEYLPKKSTYYSVLKGDITLGEFILELEKLKYGKGKEKDLNEMYLTIYKTYNNSDLSKLKNADTKLRNLNLSLMEHEFIYSVVYKYNNDVLARDFGTFLIESEYVAKDLESLSQLKESLNNANNRASEEHNKFVAEKNNLKQLEKKLKRLEKNSANIESNSKARKYLQDKLKNREDEIKNLKDELADTQDMLDRNLADYATFKNENSKLKRELKKLKFIIDSNPSMKEDLEIIEEEQNVSVDEAAKFLKDKKIFLAGGVDSSHYEEVFAKYDLSNITRVTKNKGAVTKFDYNSNYDLVVILWKTTSHRLQESCNKYFKNSKKMYFSGDNVDRLIMEMYEELSDDFE